MKIRSFITYLKENIREDEFSHLNNDLSANKKNEARWPEDEDYDYDDDSTKDYNDYGDYDDWYDDESTRDNAKKFSSNPKFDNFDDDDYEYEDEDEDEDVEHLLYLLRQMFRNSGVEDVRIMAKKNEDIVIDCHMRSKDSLRNVIKAFEVANKLKRDILSQYDSEFEMWESKSGGGILTFGFTLEEGLDDDTMPF
jgi:hypothetical protein